MIDEMVAKKTSTKKDIWAQIRKGVSLALIVFVLAIIADVIRFFGTLMILPTVGRANSANDQSQAFSQYMPTSQKHILIIGDSTAVGVGAYISKETVAGLLASDLPQADILNKGVSGARIADVRAQLKNTEGTFDMILIQAGGNDIVFMTDVADVEKETGLLIDEALLRSPSVVMVSTIDVGILPLFPKIASLFLANRSAKILPDIKKVVEEKGAIYVDLYKSKEEKEFAQEPEKLFSSDGFHPSSDGYRVAYDRLKSELIARGILFGVNEMTPSEGQNGL